MARKITTGKAWDELKDYAQSLVEFHGGSEDPEAVASAECYAHIVDMMEGYEVDITFAPEPREVGEDKEEKLREIGRWLVDTADLFGLEPELSYQVTGIFLAGLRRNWEKGAGEEK